MTSCVTPRLRLALLGVLLCATAAAHAQCSFSMKKHLQAESVKSFADVLDQQLHVVAPLSGFYGAAYAEAEPVLLANGTIDKITRRYGIKAI